MIDLNKPVQTRDGRKARILATDVAHETYPVAAAVTSANGKEEYIEAYTALGTYTKGISENYMDLVNVPVREETFRTFKFYGFNGLDNGLSLGGWPGETAEDVRHMVGSMWDGVVKVTTLDGKFVSAEVVTA